MGRAHYSENQGTERSAWQAQGSLSTLYVPACMAGGRTDKSDSTGGSTIFGLGIPVVFCLREGLG